MSTNHTPNYGLSQWERTDAVLMEDFNADNARIDTALNALETSTAWALRGKLSAAQNLHMRDVGSQLSGVTLSMPQKESWNNWDTVCAYVSYPDVPAGVTLSLQLVKADEYKVKTIGPIGSPAYLIVFFPHHASSRIVWGFILADRLIPIAAEYEYNQLTSVSIQSSEKITGPFIRAFGWK